AKAAEAVVSVRAVPTSTASFFVSIVVSCWFVARCGTHLTRATRHFEFLKCKFCNAVLSARKQRDLSILREGAIMQFVTLEGPEWSAHSLFSRCSRAARSLSRKIL